MVYKWCLHVNVLIDREIGNLKPAWKRFNQSVHMNPNHAQTWQLWGSMLYTQGEHRGARLHFDVCTCILNQRLIYMVRQLWCTYFDLFMKKLIYMYKLDINLIDACRQIYDSFGRNAWILIRPTSIASIWNHWPISPWENTTKDSNHPWK